VREPLGLIPSWNVRIRRWRVDEGGMEISYAGDGTGLLDRSTAALCFRDLQGRCGHATQSQLRLVISDNGLGIPPCGRACSSAVSKRGERTIRRLLIIWTGLAAQQPGASLRGAQFCRQTAASSSVLLPARSNPVPDNRRRLALAFRMQPNRGFRSIGMIELGGVYHRNAGFSTAGCLPALGHTRVRKRRGRARSSDR